MAYQPPKIGFSPEETKRLDAMGWPNALLGASEGEIALAYQKHVDNQRRANMRTFWMMCALIVPAVAVIAAQAWGWV